MNYIHNNTLKTFALFSLYFSTSTLQAMKPTIITIQNQINNPKSLVQLCYTHLQHYGVNKILNAPETIECYTHQTKYILTEKNELVDKAKRFALLKLSDPTSKEKQLKLKITDTKKPIIIHDFDPHTQKISITKGNKELGSFSYR